MSTLAKVPAFDAIRREDEGGEFWAARDLMEPLGYERWERFEDTLVRAQAAARNSGAVATDHFRGAAKMVQIGSGAARSIADYRLSRYGMTATHARISYNLTQAGEQVGVSREVIRRAVRSGDLPVRYPTRYPVVLHDDLMAWVIAAPSEQPKKESA